MSRLCIIILTKNEEKDIEAAVQNVRQCADEIVVVDSGSTDRTVELAKRTAPGWCTGPGTTTLPPNGILP